MKNIIEDFKITEEQEYLDVLNARLCHLIYLAMKAKGLSQNDLADKMKVDKSLVSEWLGGVHFMGVDTLFRIEKILEIKIINIPT